jgi:hypothetical protein
MRETGTAATAITTCTRCGRPLRSAKSIADRMGRTCKAKTTQAARRVTSGYTTDQVTKAVELIETAAIIIHTARARRRFQAVSSRGDAVYLVDQAAHSCTCPAGVHGKVCYHLAAADILTAA